ncbi:MAG: hypothetical protein WBA83_07245 [Burkholderiaceae bacterium]
MKEYQDTETGMIYAFENDYGPFTANNRNIPKTLTATVKPKPDESHVWYQSTWVKQEDAPAGYTPPISSVPSHNPAWMAYLRPYSAVHRDASSGLNVTLDQINANSYDGSKLAEVVTQLPLTNSTGIPALVSYDGAIAIPQCDDFPSRVEGVKKINEILCSLLLGGVHVEVLHSEDLVIGTLHDKSRLFAFTPSLHTTLRLNGAALTDRCIPLMHPRVLMVDEMLKAFHQGQLVIQSVTTFSPLFLLSGYTAMVYRNNSDALNNLWIVVEQLTEHIWRNQYMKSRSSFPATVAQAHAAANKERKLGRISTKHELLHLSTIFSTNCFRALNLARLKRNDLAHEGIVPGSGLIDQLWSVLPELIEIASGHKSLGIRQLRGGAVENWDSPARTDFEEWVNLAKAL